MHIKKKERMKKSSRREQKIEKKRIEKENHLASVAGIRTKATVELTDERFPVVKYLVNGWIVFLALYGSLGSLMSAFNIPDNLTLVFVMLFFFSMILSFMYCRQSIKILVYLAILAMSLLAVTSLFVVMNSGFSAMQNIIIGQIGDTFSLTNIREYTEYYTNRQVSIPVALFFVGVALGVVINILISEYMNIWLVSLIIVPIGFYGNYFEFMPDKIPMAALLLCLIMMIGIRFTGFYQGLENRTRFKKDMKKSTIHYSYGSDPKNNGMIGMSFFVFGLGAVLVFGLFFQDKYMPVNTPFDGIKKRTEEPVRQLLSVGILAWLPDMPWDATSGDGQLNTTGRVRQDGQVDLSVRFVPYTSNRMYLRSYIGSVYRWRSYHWDQLPYTQFQNGMEKVGLADHSLSLDVVSDLNNGIAALLKKDKEQEQVFCKNERRMDIVIEDSELSNSLSAFSPYFTLFDSNNIESISDEELRFRPTTSSLKEDQRSFTFYDSEQKELEKQTVDTLIDEYKNVPQYKNEIEVYEKELQAYDSFVRDNYLFIDKGNYDSLKKICEENNLRKDSDTVVQDVVNYLSENYTYTLNPGRVPYGKDFANYFLEDNKRGFCQHFATAAALLFRYLDVPARYVEGYVIDSENVADGEDVNEEQTSQWVQGEATTQKVVDVEITDTNSHAWVEVYEEGIGWQPVEVTLAPEEEDDSFLSDLLSGDGDAANAVMDTASNAAKGLSVGGLIILVVVPVGFFLRIVFIKIRRKRRLNVKNQNLSISRWYYYLLEIISNLSGKEVFHLSYGEISDMLAKDYLIKKETAVWVIEQAEQANFSKNSFDYRIYEQYLKEIKEMIEIIYQKQSLKKRIWLKYVKGL